MSVPIEQIWPEAFISSQPVTLVGMQTRGAFTKAWFRCRDGRTYALSKEELKAYMPAAKISRSYKK